MLARRLLVTAVFVLSAATAHAVDITTCGQIVPPGATGVLVADLTCPTPTLGCFECRPNGYGCFQTGVACTTDADCGSGDVKCATQAAIAIELKGTLDMNGHALVAPGQLAVVCRSKGPCTVTSTTGRGDISGSDGGIGMGTGKLDVSNVDIHDNLGSGIYTPLAAVRLRLSSVTANANGGIGIRSSGLKATDVTANGNGQAGIEANGKVQGSNVVTNDNAWAGLIAQRGAKLTAFTATGNGSVGPNGGAGLIVVRGAAHVSGATITGNTFDDGSGPVPLDLITVRKPKLAGTCEHSASVDAHTGDLGPTWGVCSGD
jgi:hypothetical protein